MIDLSGSVPISVRAGTRPSMEPVMTMPTGVLSQVPAGMAPIIHSGRGFHYRARVWVDAVHGADGQGSLVQRCVPPMSRKATSGDNAVAEGFFGTLKRESFGLKKAIWQMTRVQVLVAVDRYREWYIWGRINARLDYRPIAEYRGLGPQPDFSLVA